jgi:hypothetical protein
MTRAGAILGPALLFLGLAATGLALWERAGTGLILDAAVRFCG